ncbi:MAG: phosphoribosylamine--glycine ligase [Actinomycetota bacterium]
MSDLRPVLVVGGGGREHALAIALARNAPVVVVPGNPGMASTSHAFPISVSNLDPTAHDVQLVVIGPEAPLVDGLADQLRALGRVVLGPGADGAQLEGSKTFMKELLDAAHVPTAGFGTFTSVAEALEFLETMSPPYVIKTDGLASGKGVLVTDDVAEARDDVIDKLMGESFGAAGRRIVIEEGLTGTECSLLALCDGERVIALTPAQDFKRLMDGDLGPNTGGMGAYTPMPGISDEEVASLVTTTIEPLVEAFIARGIDYRGVLYAGLMLTSSGPKVLEFNARFGDPETEVLLPLLQGNLVELFTKIGKGSLEDIQPATGAAVCVVLAAPGYPEAPRGGMPIAGLGQDGQLEHPLDGVTVFHSGTSRPDPEGPFVVKGGRVLAVTAVGASLGEARTRVYDAVAQIHFDGMQYRTDIALDAAQREELG